MPDLLVRDGHHIVGIHVKEPRGVNKNGDVGVENSLHSKGD